MILVCSAPNAYETSKTSSKPTTPASSFADSVIRKRECTGESYCHLMWKNKRSSPEYSG